MYMAIGGLRASIPIAGFLVPGHLPGLILG